jgi:hypothetical protein
MMMPPGLRIAAVGHGKSERFVVIEFSKHPESERHLMNTTDHMTEPEFRAWLASGGIRESLIEETIAGARAHRDG